MNERIEKLALQAEEYALSVCDNNGHFHRIYREKFAELIVRECCNVLYDNEMGGYQVNYVLKEHFGVEE